MTAAFGTAIWMVGFHEAELFPMPSVSLNAVAGSAVVAVASGWPGVIVPTPDDAVAGPEAYVTADAGMISSGPPPPVTNVLVDADAVHDAVSSARASVTVTVPSWLVTVPPGEPAPRAADPGALMDKAPEPRVKWSSSRRPAR